MSWVFNGTINQKQTPAFYADVLANRPPAGYNGRIFFATDSPYGIFRDNGTTWTQIATNTNTTGFVPYSGASQNLNLGIYSITASAANLSSANILASNGISLNVENNASAFTTIQLKNNGSGNIATFYNSANTGAVIANSGAITVKSAALVDNWIGINYAYFGHPNNNNATDYALIQSSTGATILNSANVLYLRTAGTSRLDLTDTTATLSVILNSSTRININGATDNAVYALNVSGAANFTNAVNISTGYNLNFNGGTDAFIYADASGGGRINVNGTNQLQLSTGSTARLTIDNAGSAIFSGTLGINGTSDNIKGSTYTPTLTNNAGTSALVASQVVYLRIGDRVHVQMMVSLTPTGLGNLSFKISLPFSMSVVNQVLSGLCSTLEFSAGRITYDSSTECIVYFQQVALIPNQINLSFSYSIV